MLNSSELLLQSVRKLPSLNQKGYDIILCYHSIDSDNDIFSVSPTLFEKQIKALYRSFRLVNFEQIIKEKNNGHEVRVAISFDDGYKSVIDTAFPILAKLHIAAGVFVIGSSHKHIENNKPHLNLSDCKKLLKNGWTVGWHTDNHINLLNKSNSIVSRDFKSAKRAFEKRLRKKIVYVAYPFGKYSSDIENLAKDNFQHAFAVNGGRANNNKFTIDRITVTSHMSHDDLVQLIKPLGIIMNRLFTYTWSLKD